MKAFNEKIILRNLAIDPSGGGKNLIAAINTPVAVYETGTTNLADIFDLNEVQIDNPTSTDIKGNVAFKVADGVYDVVGGTGENETRWDQVEIIDLTVPLDVKNIKHYTLAEAEALSGAVIGQVIQITDRANGQFEAVSSLSVTTNGYNIIQGAGSIAWALITDGVMRARQFGVPTDGIAAETAINALASYVKGDGQHYSKVIFDYGTYSLSDVCTFDDFIDFEIEFEDVIFKSIATSAKDTMLMLSSWVQSCTTGKVRFINDANGYFKTPFKLVAGTKGTTKNAFYNLTSSYFENGLTVGFAEEDLVNSENTFYNYNQFECATAVKGGGSQTGASFVGCNLLGVPLSRVPSAEIHSMWLEGGFWTVVGGEVLTTQSNAFQCIKMTPHNNATPDYPQLRITGTQIETASPLLSIENPDNLTLNPSGQGGQFSITNSGGYCGGSASANANFISAANDFTGKLQVTGNNFYAGATRNAFNISVGDGAIIETDKSSWGNNFRDWIGGANGGVFVSDDNLVAGAFNSGGGTYNTGVKTALKFGNLYPNARYTRYNASYNLSTGVFTVPAGGIKSLKIDVGILASGLNGSLFVEVDGAQVSYGTIGGSSGNMAATIEGLVEGQLVIPYLQASTSSVTLTNGKFNYIAFTVSN